LRTMRNAQDHADFAAIQCQHRRKRQAIARCGGSPFALLAALRRSQVRGVYRRCRTPVHLLNSGISRQPAVTICSPLWTVRSILRARRPQPFELNVLHLPTRTDAVPASR
jgi:hypothetical protein